MNRDAQWFDALIDEEGAFDPFTERGWRTLQRRFEAMVPHASAGGAELLDVGCGTGSSRTIYTRVRGYTGLDHSVAALRFAREAHRGDRWLAGDALRLPFADARFDVVAFSSVLHHLADRAAALREAFRVVRAGGRVFAFDPNLLHPPMALFRHPSSPFYRSEGVSPDERPLLGSQLAAAFRDAGFRDVRQRAQADIPYRQVAVGWLDKLLPLYNAADWLLARSGLGRWLGSFVVTVATR